MNDLKAWIMGHRIASIAIGLLAVTLALIVMSMSSNKPAQKLDPQSQIGVEWIKPAGTEAAYAGNEACKSCHPREFDPYSKSPHSKTVRAIPQGEERKEFDSSQTVFDEHHNISYSVLKTEGKNQFVANTGKAEARATAKWLFGSGTHAWTYLGQNGPAFLQFRISYYAADGSWNFTPGSGPNVPLTNPLGDVYTSAQAAACFGCHSTVLTGTRQNLDIAHSVLNVGCESCHGPSKAHVESASAGTSAGRAMVKPALHTGPEIMTMCGACHRIPVAVSDEAAANNTQIARFPGLALVRSRCFKESAGKLSCISCHDPHQSTRQQQASFESKCLNCHSKPHGATCTLNEHTGCINCHMPSESIARKLPLNFHNHWIRRNPNAPPGSE